MKQSLGTVLTVARWEFMRYFKWRQELIGLLIMGSIIGAFYGGVWLMDRYKAGERFEVAAIGLEQLELEAGQYGRLQLIDKSDSDQAVMKERLDAGELDGLLRIENAQEAGLTVASEGGWQDELEALLNQKARELALSEAGISEARYQSWSQPITLSREIRRAGVAAPEGPGSRLFALVVLGLMLFAVFNSFAYYFASITTEKQHRVSEQILSMIPAQAWIDGKILGLTTLGLKSLLNVVLWGVVGLSAFVITSGRLPDLSGLLPPAGTAALIVGFGVLGLLFWNSCLAAIAATIDDPNSSSRSSLMMLPIIPVVLVFFGLDIATSPFMIFMSWFPPTAWAAMPARQVMEGVAAWELIGAFLLLMAAVWWIRLAAGRIFATGMLMYGKEPGLGMLWQAIRGK